MSICQGGWDGTATQIWEEWSTMGQGWRRRQRLFPLSGSTGAGNEVLILLMGRDKQSDQSMSTIAGQQRARERGAG